VLFLSLLEVNRNLAMKKLIIFLVLLSTIITAEGQKKWEKQGLQINMPVCYSSDEVHKTYIPPSDEILYRLKSTEKKSNIHVTYSLFPQEAKEAFEYAVNIWEQIISSPVPIYMRANWRTMDNNVLGSCGPSDYYTDFEGIPIEGLYYPVSVVEKITKKQITDMNSPDMTATFNKNVDWYFGTDGNTPDSLYDFVTVVLHEIAHGLGFTGFFFVNQNLGTYGYYDIGDAAAFDQMVEKSTGEVLIDQEVYENPSEELRKALESNLLYLESPVTRFNNGGSRARLYAPSSWDDGSSVYHLNDLTYRAGDENSLMTHAFGRGEAIHDPGPITEGIMADIGWKYLFIEFEQLKDKEEVTPLIFDAAIESDFLLDTTSLSVIYSKDSFQTHADTLPLVYTNDQHFFTAQLTPEANSKNIAYYITATDEKTRTFTRPANAPEEFYTIKFGPDNEKPVIAHNPIEYYFLLDDAPVISTRVTDNLGVDSVFLEYAINGIPQDPVPFLNDTTDSYKTAFNFTEIELKDGDEISYIIVAVDASSNANIARFPEEENFSFKIEHILEPVGGYVNDFETDNRHFILSDFDIYTETGFENNALHSPHPYPSPEIDDSVFNFTTLLKHPIILQPGGIMSFDEVVLVEPGSQGTIFGDENFWDFVVVEGSKDQGETWLPIDDGYDSRANAIWEENYNRNVREQVSETIGSSEWYINREIDMLENGNFSAGDTILIRFRLFSDPYAYGWGWAIDNLRIQFPVSASLPVLSPGNVTIYPNPFNDLINVSIHPKSNIENLQIDVYNSIGQKVKSFQQRNIQNQMIIDFDLNNFRSGIYLVVIHENGKQVFSKKLIKSNYY